MTDEIWKRDEVESPCVNICVIHPDARICTGCLRSIEEITAWSKMSNEERRDLVKTLPDRQKLLKKRRGGRTARLNREAE